MNSTETTHYAKHVKCSLGQILLRPEETTNFIEKRCLAVSQMAVKASHLCRIMVDELLEREEEGGEKDESTTLE